MITILAFLFVLGVLIFVHELGHFLVARWCGIRVAAFSIGFGRDLTGFTDRRGTRWKLSAIPLGVLGGATIVLYGLVGVLGVRIWLTIHVDFSKPLNQMTAAIPLIIGIADFTWHAGDLTFTGIALGSIAALLVYHGMRLLGSSRELIPQRGT